MLHAVIMAGGSGTRFWPQSRARYPKQFLKLTGERTMIQQTADRCDGLIPPDRTWVVTNHSQLEPTRSQLPGIPAANLLVEPAARNTAPCVGLAAIHLLKQDAEAVMLVMPADHLIAPREAFQEAVRGAVKLVESDRHQLVLFGVPPVSPATGYGYIERGAPLAGGSSACRVASFREKPPRETAEQYLASGNFYWNCGIFCWRADTILDQLRQHEPDMHARLMRVADAAGTDRGHDVLQAEFPQMDSVPIDCAVLERADRVCVIEAPFTWDDVGSWLALPRLNAPDDQGNTLDGRVQTLDSRGCIIRSTADHLVTAVGMEDCIIVHTPDATLVARRDDADNIKKLLELLRDNGHADYL